MLYAPGLTSSRFEDDLAAYYSPLPASTLHFFTHPAQYRFYRPLPGTLFLLAQRHFGEATWPVHAVNLLGHVLTAVLLLLVLLRLIRRRTPAIIAAFFFLLTPSASFNVLGNDTTGQVWVALFGGLSVWLLYRGKLAFSASMLALALLCKETALVYLPLLVLCEAVLRKERHGSGWVQLIPHALIVLAYFEVRRLTGAMGILNAGGAYAWGLGLHNLRNLILFASGLATPFSTVDVYGAWRRDALRFAGLALGSSIFAGITIYGLVRERGERTRIGAFTLLLLGAAFPFALMRHIGESYLGTALPFFAPLVGIGWGGVLRAAGRNCAWRGAAALALSIAVIVQVAAVRSKAALMQANGRSAAVLLEEIRPFARDLPPAARLYLRHVATPDEIVYSTFLRPGFLLLAKNDRLPRLLRRPDLNVQVLEAQDSIPPIPASMEALVLTDARGRVVAEERRRSP
jgi:hypothetical protein